MMLRTITSFLLLLFAVVSQAQQVQIIHNSADPLLDTVDIYVNGQLALDDVQFRENSAFLSLPPVGQVTIGIKAYDAASTDNDLLTVPYTPGNSDEILIASGVATPGNFAPNPDGTSIGASVEIVSNAKTAADDNSKVALNVFHGSTDAPTVDAVIRGTNLAFDDLSYKDASSYIEVDPGVYTIDIYDETRTDVIFTYTADLSGLAGEAITVYASGFLTPANNQGGEAFGLYAALSPTAPAQKRTAVMLPAVTTASVQIIHNAADPAADSVDVYLNGQAVGALADFKFRTATPYIDLPANQMIEIGIAPGNSQSYDDTLTTFDFNLLAGETYQVVANGVLSPGNFSSNPDARETGFTLWATGAKSTSDDQNNVALKVVHGATDAPTVDVVARGPGLTLVDDAAYGDITAYAEVPAANYRLDITGAMGSPVLFTYDVDLAPLAGQAATVLASGFVNPTANNDGAPFGLIAVLADGTVLPLETVNTAKVQIIHNAADPAADSVDIYLDGNAVSALADFKFRTATPYVDLPANREITIGVAPGNSADYSDTLTTFNFRLMAGESYVVIANGVVGTGFAANPDGRDIGFDLWPVGARMMANSQDSVDFRVVHGATDAPTIDVRVAESEATIVDNAAYGDITDYISVAPDTYTLEILDETGSSQVAVYEADLSGLAGGSAIVFASGFLDNTNANQMDNAFGLYAALADGTVVTFGKLVNTQEMDENTALKVYPNPAQNQLMITGNDVLTYRILSLDGRTVANERVNGLDQVQVNTTQLQNGTYVLEIETENGISRQKVMVAR